MFMHAHQAGKNTVTMKIENLRSGRNLHAAASPHRRDAAVIDHQGLIGSRRGARCRR